MVQGFGNVGSVAVKELANIGVKIIGVSDRTGGFVDTKGLPVDKLLEVADKNHSLEGCPYGDKISNAEVLELKCDILVPAALEMQITEDNAARLQCRILAEGANGPTTPEADAILQDKGVFLIPDILANAGGVVVSYFEWVQDLQNFFWNEDEVNNKLREILVKAFQEVLDDEPEAIGQHASGGADDRYRSRGAGDAVARPLRIAAHRLFYQPRARRIEAAPINC